MAIPFQGGVRSAIQWGLVKKIEVRQQGTGSFLDVGRVENVQTGATPLSEEGDPAATQYVFALEFKCMFDIIQTAKSYELTAMMSGTAGTGLIETDVEIKFTFADGRTITLGAVTASPMRLVGEYVGVNESGAQIIKCTASVVEPITTFIAKVSA